MHAQKTLLHLVAFIQRYCVHGIECRVFFAISNSKNGIIFVNLDISATYNNHAFRLSQTSFHKIGPLEIFSSFVRFFSSMQL